MVKRLGLFLAVGLMLMVQFGCVYGMYYTFPPSAQAGDTVTMVRDKSSLGGSEESLHSYNTKIMLENVNDPTFMPRDISAGIRGIVPVYADPRSRTANNNLFLDGFYGGRPLHMGIAVDLPADLEPGVYELRASSTEVYQEWRSYVVIINDPNVPGEPAYSLPFAPLGDIRGLEQSPYVRVEFPRGFQVGAMEVTLPFNPAMVPAEEINVISPRINFGWTGFGPTNRDHLKMFYWKPEGNQIRVYFTCPNGVESRDMYFDVVYTPGKPNPIAMTSATVKAIDPTGADISSDLTMTLSEFGGGWAFGGAITDKSFPYRAQAGDTVTLHGALEFGNTNEFMDRTNTTVILEKDGDPGFLPRDLSTQIQGVVQSPLDARSKAWNYSPVLGGLSDGRPFSTAIVLELPADLQPGTYTLSVSSTAILNTWVRRLRIIDDPDVPGRPFCFGDAGSCTPMNDETQVELEPFVRVAFTEGVQLGAMEVTLPFDPAVVPAEQINVISPRINFGSRTIGKTNRDHLKMFYWKPEGNQIKVYYVCPKGVESRYMFFDVVYPRESQNPISMTEGSFAASDINGLDVSTRLEMTLSAGLPTATDTDGDGLTDAVETQIGTDPTLHDTDGDGLGDFYEVNYDGDPAYTTGSDLNPLEQDTDGDGFVDGQGGLVPVADYPTGIDRDGDGFVDGEGDLGTDPLSTVCYPGNQDMNLDGVTDLRDALVVQRMAVGLIAPSALDILHADTAPAGGPDGVINTADVLMMLKRVLQ